MSASDKPLIDKHGHRHSENVLREWSSGILTALQIRPADTGTSTNTNTNTVSADKRIPDAATGQFADQSHAPAQAVASAKD